jgi:hypothetical protein
MKRFIVACAALGAAACAWSDVVAQWHFDEAPGTGVAADSVGDADGVVSGSADFAPGGVSGNAIAIDQAGDGLVNMGQRFAFSTGSFTVVTWVRTQPGFQSPDQIYLSSHTATVVAGYLLGINANGAYGRTDKAWFYNASRPGEEPFSTTDVNDGEWHQVVGVYPEAGLAQIYVDGAPYEDAKARSPIGTSGAPFIVGGLTFSGVPRGTFNGDVDEVQLYDHSLSPREVRMLFDEPTETLDGFCVADFNEDGAVNSTDFVAFLNAFVAADPFADVDGEGRINSQDFVAFLNAFVAGC